MSENEKYVGNGVRGKGKVKKIGIVAAALLLVFAVALAGFALADKFVGADNVSDSLSQLVGEDKNSGFPAKFSTNDILDVKAKGNKLYVLTEKFITPLSEKGEIGASEQITYAKPAIYANDSYAIVFDRLSNKYTVIDKKGKYREVQDQSGSQILVATVTDDGKVLLSLGSNFSSSVLHVTDKKGEDILIWSCGDEYIVSFDMSGDRIYCAALGAYGGEIYTKLYVLEIGKEETVCEYTLHGSACLALKHISSDKFSVLCDDGIYVCRAKKEEPVKTKVAFSSKILFYDIDSDGNIAVVFDSNEALSKNLLNVYDSDAKILHSVSVDENMLDLAIEGKQTYLLYDDEISSVTPGGKMGQKLSFTGKCVGLLTSGKKIYCYGLGGVYKAVQAK